MQSGLRPQKIIIIRILIVTPHYPPAICGIGDHSRLLRQYLERRGHQVLVYTATSTEEPGVIRADKWGSEMRHQLPHVIGQHGISHLLWQYAPYSYQRHGLPFYLPGILRQLRSANLRQVVFFHEVSLRLWGEGWRHSARGCLQRLIAREMHRLADAAGTSLPLYQSYFSPNRPLLQIPISSNLPLFSPSAKATQASGLRLMCFANRLSATLLQAVASLNHSMCLTAIGAMEKTHLQHILHLNRGHQVHLSFSGELPSAILARWLPMAHIWLQPQPVNRRGQGGVSAKNGSVAAAMAAGRAIISLRGDMTDPKIFCHGENIHFAEEDTPEGWRNAINALLTNEDYRQHLERRAVATYRKYLSWRANLPLWEALLHGNGP